MPGNRSPSARKGSRGASESVLRAGSPVWAAAGGATNRSSESHGEATCPSGPTSAESADPTQYHSWAHSEASAGPRAAH